MPRLALAVGLAALLVLPGPAPGSGATLVDMVGRTVELAATPRRIVSLAPSITETLFALGVGGRVAGVTSLCDWPPEAAAAPRVGGVVNPSIEAIAALDPDLVLATADGNRAEDVARLSALGYPVYVVDTRSLDEVLESVERIGDATGSAARARELVASLRRRRAAVRTRVAGEAPVAVFLALERRPLISAGAGTFVGEMAALAGGRNIAAAAPVKYPVFSLERLLAENPAVIVDAADPQPLGAEEVRERWRALPGAAGLRAVRGGRVVSVGQATFFRPGPRIMDSLERLAGILHPHAAP